MFATRYLLYALTISAFFPLINGSVVKIPIPTIIAYEPYGIKVTLPSVDGISEFFLWGNVNEELENTDLGKIRLEVFEPTHGQWVIEDKSVSLKTGDIIHYILFVKIHGIMHRLNRMSYQVQDVIPRPPTDASHEIVKPTPCKNKDIIINIKDDSLELKQMNKEETIDLSKLSTINITDCQIELEMSPESVKSDILEITLSR